MVGLRISNPSTSLPEPYVIFFNYSATQVQKGMQPQQSAVALLVAVTPVVAGACTEATAQVVANIMVARNINKLFFIFSSPVL
jgi:hypothetical protein